jgi:hypothetical protein
MIVFGPRYFIDFELASFGHARSYETGENM